MKKTILACITCGMISFAGTVAAENLPNKPENYNGPIANLLTPQQKESAKPYLDPLVANVTAAQAKIEEDRKELYSITVAQNIDEKQLAVVIADMSEQFAIVLRNSTKATSYIYNQAATPDQKIIMKKILMRKMTSN